jgi:hypothetical protein
VGCEGIDAVAGESIAVADMDQFAGAVTKLLTSVDGGEQMAVAARALARARYDWRAIGETAVRALKAVLFSPARSHA